MSERNDLPSAQQDNPLRLYSQASVVQMAQAAGLVPELYVKTVMSSCFRGKVAPTAEQFLAFMLIAREHGLNPILKQIHAFAQDGGVQPIIGVDGWLAKMNEHPQFDGVEFSYGEEDGDLYCEGIFHRKDRAHPTVVREWLSECRRSTDPWTRMPKRMLRNRVICQGGRIAFSLLVGVMEQDEGEQYFETSAEVVAERAAASAAFHADMDATRRKLAAPVKSSAAATSAGASQDAGAAPVSPEDLMAKVRTCQAVPHLENLRKKYRQVADNDGYLPEFELACNERGAELRGDAPTPDPQPNYPDDEGDR